MGAWAAALPYIIQGAAQLGSAALDLTGAKQSAEASKRNVDKQIQWNDTMSRTAHQREVADLEAAGLNPILSAGGQGAQTLGITPAMPDTSGYSRAGDRLTAAVESILKIKNLDKQNDILDAQENNINADTEKKRKETEESGSRIKLNKHQQKLLDARISEITSNIMRNNVMNKKDKIDMLRIGKEIKNIESKTELNYVEAELKKEQKELLKEEELLTTIKQRQGMETYKAQIMDNKIKSVHTKMRYIDEYLDKCKTIMKMGTDLIDSIIPG